ncbi:kinase family protein [Teratosphaeria nubilosa]|uniref:Kinase family protein n=1 Tax=Teratosphaeria nubilosa TaxID=161662 RepID=A0A6G1LF80_9PEZI|nr:kinase family protein [Teratosphaeria nubilosa]
MDFFKSAVASIAKGPAFPYSFGDRVDIDQSIWTLHNGTKREDGSKCSIFSFDVSANRSRLPLAKNALRKFRTLRHPGIVKVLDTVETDQLIYIATERVTPLTRATKRQALSEESLKWGLHTVAKTLKFINDEAASVHGNIRAASIFTSESGEWRIGGLEITSSMKEDDAILFSHGSLVPDIGRYSPPEVVKGGWDSVRKTPTHAVDAYQYGILVTEVFNGGYSGTEQAGTTRNIPLQMQQSYKRLSHAVPKMRLSVGHFLEQGSRSGGFFDTPLIQLSTGIDSLGLKSEAEKDVFLKELDEVAQSDDFPEDYFKAKVLPELLKSIEFGGGGPKSFGLCMRIATKMSDEEWDSQITPVVVRLFTSSDRALRVCLLDNLPLMIDRLSQKLVSDKIFPQMVTGFGDLAPLVREQTVKAVLVVVPKMNDRVINGELLRHLAKTANDEQPGIRTNTTICLGKIARNLSPGSRAKVLSAAFSRALRDPFVHARNAALLALAATSDIFSEDDCATKMLPAICPSLVDKEKMIRDQANKTLNIYLDRVRKYSQTLPDTVLPPTSSEQNSRVASPQPNAAGNAASQGWAGWAVSSFTNKLGSATGQIQPNSNSVIPTPAERGQTPPANGASARPTTTLHPAQSAPVVPRISASTLRNVSTPPSEAEADFGDGWGDMGDTTGEEAFDPFSEPAPASKSTTVAYDDGGEPDFEGWLNAQAKAKQQSKRPLPKGLAPKKTTPVVKPAASTVKKTLPSKPVASKAASAPKAEAKQDEENWGDAWG